MKFEFLFDEPKYIWVQNKSHAVQIASKAEETILTIGRKLAVLR